DGESLAEISNYIDEQRSNPSNFWQKTASPWHYVTVAKGKTYSSNTVTSKGDAITALAHYTNILKDKSNTKERRSLALKFIVHLIADLHQPLHVGNGTDSGGNKIRVKFFGRPTNLHRIWDSGLIDREQLSYTEWSNWLTRKIDGKTYQQWANIDPMVWIEESATLRDQLYPKKKNLSWDYRYKHIDSLKLRLSQAGVRIAVYLNSIFKN
ncbi:MAG: S1/P1 nuclease, partial [Kangiellaceae bacterium]|nr:S1/P1 nuclease [Kangiellaceae bacterium]